MYIMIASIYFRFIFKLNFSAVNKCAHIKTNKIYFDDNNNNNIFHTLVKFVAFYSNLSAFQTNARDIDATNIRFNFYNFKQSSYD